MPGQRRGGLLDEGPVGRQVAGVLARGAIQVVAPGQRRGALEELGTTKVSVKKWWLDELCTA